MSTMPQNFYCTYVFIIRSCDTVDYAGQLAFIPFMISLMCLPSIPTSQAGLEFALLLIFYAGGKGIKLKSSKICFIAF